MWPILFKVGSLEVPSFGILALAGLFVAMLIQRREAARLGYDGKKVEELILVSVICAWIGAKGLYVLTTPGVALSSVMSAGYVFYGGVLAGVPAAWILARRAGIPGGRLVDIITPGMTLGLAIARIGCLCAGCDYGAPAPGGERWWTLTFRYADSIRPELRLVPPDLQGVPLYPSQPLMALSLLATFAVIYPLRKRLTPWPGAVLFLYLVVEPPLRFLIEFTRGDADRGFVGPGQWLSTSQAIAALMAPVGLALLLWRTRQPGTPPPALATPAAAATVPAAIDNAVEAR